MASTTESHPYTYIKPSQLATRSLVSDNKPPLTTSSASHDHAEADTQGKPVLTRKTTDNYEKAAAAAVQNKPAESAGVLAGTDRPGLGRTASWKIQDKRRDHMEGLLSGQPNGLGYSSTAGQ